MVEIRIVDAAMRDVPRDGKSTGEVVVRAPWLTKGYLRNPEGTAALWAGGYLHTGDVGYLDDDGALHVTDRIKDVIKSGGEWISSLALESIASAVPGVAEVAAIGLPDATWGEVPLLAVALKGTDLAAVEAGITAAIGAQIAAGKLSKWAAPRKIVEVAALPKTSVGKIDKKALRVQFTP